MKRTSVLAGSIVVIVGAVALFYFRSGVTSATQAPFSTSEAAVTLPTSVTATMAAPAASAAPSPSTLISPTAPPARASVAAALAPSAASLSDASAPPTADQVRQDIAAHPEAPSQAIMRFSVHLGQKMETALLSESNAVQLFAELEHCALNDGKIQLADAARVLCLSDADRLALQYAGVLRAKYENLESRVDSSVVQMKKMMDLN